MHEMNHKRPRSKVGPILLGCFLAVILIIAWEAASSHVGYSWTSQTDSATGEIHKIRMRDGRWRLAVDFRGDIVMKPDDSGIERLGSDAFLKIEERNGRERHRLEAVPGPDGRPEIEWEVNREPAEFDADGRKWLAEILPRIYRTTGIDAEGRVGRLLAVSGVAGVLREIDKIGSDHVQAIYFEQLLKQAESSEQDLERILRRMAREISSDHEMSRLIALIPADSLRRESTAEGFLAAARTIGSDHELRRALTVLLGVPAFPDFGETVLDATTTLGNDFELAELLKDVVEAYPEDRPLPSGFARALRTIGSGFERRKVLGTALRRPGLGSEELEMLLHAAKGINSDFELAELLVELARGYPAELPEAYYRAVTTIGSDYEQRRVLDAVAARPDLSAQAVRSVLETSLGIGSDHELAQLLRQLAETHPIGDQVRPAFDRAVATIGSAHERERVLAEVKTVAAGSESPPVAE